MRKSSSLLRMLLLLLFVGVFADSADVLAQSGDDGAANKPEADQSAPAETTEETKEKSLSEKVDGFFGAVNKVIGFVFFFNLFDLVGIKGNLPLAVLWLVFGAIFFTCRMGFINLRGFKHAILVTAGKFDSAEEDGEVSHFQALTAALSATVGLGNIAGVAIAIATGGPGATFWMIAAGFLGMTSKFVECTLGQKYREVRPDGRVMGGAMFYLSKGLGEMGMSKFGKFLAVFFAVLCIGGSFGGGCAFQVNQSLNAVSTSVPALGGSNGWIYGLVMTIAVGVVIIGGIKAIAKVAEKIVPLMCCVYVIAAMSIILMNADKVPDAFSAIFTQAFNPSAVFGGFIGVLVIGFQRAAFSNEAGVGSAAIAHSAAKTEYPVREGIVALLEPFIDTIVICTMTALVIVISGAYWSPDSDRTWPEVKEFRTFQKDGKDKTFTLKEEVADIATEEVKLIDLTAAAEKAKGGKEGEQAKKIAEIVKKQNKLSARIDAIVDHIEAKEDVAKYKNELASLDLAKAAVNDALAGLAKSETGNTTIIAFSEAFQSLSGKEMALEPGTKDSRPTASEVKEGEVDDAKEIADMRYAIARKRGAQLTSLAMDRQFRGFKYILAIAVMLFAYSTMISWSYYGERCWAYLFGDGASMIYRLLFLLFVFLGSIVSATNVLDFGDLMILGMAFPNIIGLLILSGQVSKDLKSYWSKHEAGEFKQNEKPE
jgi:alanine or glycine:cation symporter, AGCS family